MRDVLLMVAAGAVIGMVIGFVIGFVAGCCGEEDKRRKEGWKK